MPEWTNPNNPVTPAAPKPLASWYAPGLSDGLGDRLLMFDNSTAPSLELLRFRPDLAQVPGFEAALREQVQRLAPFRHPAFARIRAVQRLEPDDDLALISNCMPGKRLSEVLHRARGAAVAAAVIQQLAPALVLFQQQGGGLAHGVLSPDRIIVSPEGQFTIVEHVVGPAIETLGLGPSQLASLGIALPPGGGDTAPRLDVATDWYQLGLVAVSVLLGRQVTASDLPQLERLVDGVSQSAGRDGTVLSPWIRQWLDHALQISGRGIASSADARAALDAMLGQEQAGGSRRLEAGPPEVTQPTAPPPLIAAWAEPAEPAAPEPIDARPDVERVPVASSPSASPAVAPPVIHEPEARPTIATAPVAAQVAPAPARSPEPVPVPQVPLTEFGSERKVERQAQPAPLPRQHRPAAPKAVPKRAAPRPAVRAARPATPSRVQHMPAAGVTPARAVERRGFSTAIVVALVLIVVVQAGVIALMARALWFAPPPTIAVQTAASGENVLVSSKPAESTPLRLAAAPDLSWVSVTSPSVAGVVGAKVAAARTGSVRISSPISLKVFEKGRQIGSVPGGDLKVAPGKHEIELVNLPFAYRLKQSIEVEAGQTISIHVAPAHGWATIYAVPTAEVAINGKPVGRTPLGPLPLALGEHTVTFTHSTGATDRQRITVKSGETVRVIGNPRR